MTRDSIYYSCLDEYPLDIEDFGVNRDYRTMLNPDLDNPRQEVFDELDEIMDRY